MAEIQKIQHLRSSSPTVAGGTSAKAPTSLLPGQIAINDISTDPTIYLKDSVGNIIEFKGKVFVENLVNSLAGGTMLTDTGYRNVLEIATTLKTFLTGTNDADVVINKWTELQNFLNAIPDSATTLIGMFAALAGNGLSQVTTTAGDGTKSVVLSVKAANDSVVVDASGVKADTQDSLASTSTTKPLSAAQGKALNEGKVDKTTQVIAGKGMTGGGALSGNVTMNVVSANDGITVNDDNIQLNTVDNLTTSSTTKPLSSKQGKILNDRLAMFENAFSFVGAGTEADPLKVRVNYDIYSVKEVSAYGEGTGGGGGTGGGAGALYECADTAIADYNPSTTASKVLAVGDILQYDGTHWRNVSNGTSLISGLDAIITELRRLVSTTNDGLMSKADKAKLDGIEANANKYVHPNTAVSPGTYKSVTVDEKGHITGGTNPTTLSGFGITDATPSSHVGSGGAAHANATTTVDGFMSSADKTKLNGIATGANNYVHPTTSGNKHIPTGGAAGNILSYSADGTAAWTNVIDCGTY